MADKKAGAYGTSNGGDTGFRKTWDREEYAQKSREHEKARQEEAKARYEAAAAGKKYHRRASTPPDARETEARSSRLDVSALVGKTMLVPAGAGVGKRGKSAGFYCPDCDLTFKDNHNFVDHLNSTQHLKATGQTGEVKRSSLPEVHHRLRWLKRKQMEDARDIVVNLNERLQMSKEQAEKERDEKRRKRNEKRRKTPGGLGHAEVKIENDGIIC